MVFTWVLRKKKSDGRSPETDRAPEAGVPAICLRVEDGLLMAFGPDGDPVPPSLLKSTRADDAADELLMESGAWVDRQRVIDVLDAQQQGALSEHPNDMWIEVMLGLAGSFEQTAPEELADEPDGPTPTLPEAALAGRDDADRPLSEWVTRLAFDEAETASMADADALLFRGLTDGMSLSAGRFDRALGGWVLRPHQLPTLAIQRADGAASHVEIGVTAVAVKENRRRWPAATKVINLA